MASQSLNRLKQLGLSQLFERYPEFSIIPSTVGELALAGTIDFQTSHPACGEFTEAFSIEIHVPSSFPLKVPRVLEVGARIESTFHHIGEQELCLGAELRLLLLTRQHPTLLGFIDHCVLPYLIGYSVFKRTGSMPFSELEHGVRGLLDDYRNLLGVKDDSICIGLLAMLRFKKRIANKKLCPCGSGKRLGQCHNRSVNRLRSVGPRRELGRIVNNLIRMDAYERSKRTNRPAVAIQRQ
jgi:hypothetical protein